MELQELQLLHELAMRAVNAQSTERNTIAALQREMTQATSRAAALESKCDLMMGVIGVENGFNESHLDEVRTALAFGREQIVARSHRPCVGPNEANEPARENSSRGRVTVVRPCGLITRLEMIAARTRVLDVAGTEVRLRRQYVRDGWDFLETLYFREGWPEGWRLYRCWEER